ncbi:DUF6279 family lipoprotein [Variovorax sp. M-6]|uniref:DUF6279 family lipoprotein n=1 Tax=Variovorax sp. M-6 TaxID=3233041 RepID=UPI003F9C131C
MPLSRNCCAKLARIIGVLALGAALAACSAVKLAYNNLPEVGYWWLDGYVDFDDAQTPRVREELRQLLAWHRRDELPKIADLLQQAQALAPADLTPAQACALFDALRLRLLALAERAEPAGTALALSLSESQLEQLARKYEKTNDKYKQDWLDRPPAQQREKRYDQFLDRSEDFYGRLDTGQRELLRQQFERSAFDPRAFDAERRERQQEVLTLLRRFSVEKTSPAQARSAIKAYVARIAEPPPGPLRDRQRAAQQESCRTVAALHNRTSDAQRQKAVRRLRAYEDDLRQLAEAS